MNQSAAEPIRSQVDAIYRNESRRVFATPIRSLGDFDLAEEAMHEAFSAAVTQWARDAIPTNPRAWLISAGRFTAIDTIRRRSRFDSFLPEIAPSTAGADATARIATHGTDFGDWRSHPVRRPRSLALE